MAFWFIPSGKRIFLVNLLLSLVYKKKISHVKPKWEFNVATIIPNRFRANRVQPESIAVKKAEICQCSFYSIASRDVKFYYYSVGISFVTKCF